MQLSWEKNTNRPLIQRYTPGEICIDNHIYRHSIILSSSGIIPWEVGSYLDINYSKLEILFNLKCNLIILGTGTSQHFISTELLGTHSQKIGIEVMDTHAACRTYNLLAAENRDVVAALIIR